MCWWYGWQPCELTKSLIPTFKNWMRVRWFSDHIPYQWTWPLWLAGYLLCPHKWFLHVKTKESIWLKQCWRELRFSVFHFAVCKAAAFTFRRQEASLCCSVSAPAREPVSQNGGDERECDILPWQLPWPCALIMTLWRIRQGGIPPESDYRRSLRPTLL